MGHSCDIYYANRYNLFWVFLMNVLFVYIFMPLMDVDIDNAWDTLWSFLDDLWEIVVENLVEGVILEAIWTTFVHLFTTLANVWGFMFIMCVFLLMFHRKYIASL